MYFDATLERNRYDCRSRHPSRSHFPPKVTPKPSRAAEAAQPSSDFGGTAEPSPAEPISAEPAQPTQLSRIESRLSVLELSGEPTYRYVYIHTYKYIYIYTYIYIYDSGLQLSGPFPPRRVGSQNESTGILSPGPRILLWSM